MEVGRGVRGTGDTWVGEEGVGGQGSEAEGEGGGWGPGTGDAWGRRGGRGRQGGDALITHSQGKQLPRPCNLLACPCHVHNKHVVHCVSLSPSTMLDGMSGSHPVVTPHALPHVCMRESQINEIIYVLSPRNSLSLTCAPCVHDAQGGVRGQPRSHDAVQPGGPPAAGREVWGPAHTFTLWPCKGSCNACCSRGPYCTGHACAAQRQPPHTPCTPRACGTHSFRACMDCPYHPHPRNA